MITKKNITTKQNITIKKKNISKKSVPKIKHIYIKNNNGFGNKVFDLIFAIYLYNLYNTNTNTNTNRNTHKCIIHYVLIKSLHDKPNDPNINNIFLKTKSKINFINEQQYKKINKNHSIKINKIYNDNPMLQVLSKFPKYEDLQQYNKIDNNFKLVYKMYKTFTKQDKNIFNMNKNILSDKNMLDKITSHEYSLVHIRYGDKLDYLSKIINKPNMKLSQILTKDDTSYNNINIDQFILYTPEYYIDKINELLDTTPQNMNVYIITDSGNIVKKFIMNNNNHSFTNNPRIVLLDKMTWWDSFYLLYYASHIILSASTFCFTGAYFNKKNAKCVLLLYHHNYNKANIAPDEYAISPYWKISNDRKYILNYNPKIAYEVIKFKYKYK
jgi:hypothetical protein